jgi:anti-sigma B factor antagonist
MKKPVSASSGTQVRMSFAKPLLNPTRANALGIASDPLRDAHRATTEPIVISAVGELDLSTVDSFRSTVMDAVGDSASSPVVIDLMQVTFIDSTTLSVLVGAHKHLSAQKRQLTIRTRQPLVLRLFDITGLTSLLKIEA